MRASLILTNDSPPVLRSRACGQRFSDEASFDPENGLNPRSNMAILMVMMAQEHLALADVKNRLSEVVDQLEREHGRVVVTKHGRPAVVMLSVEDLESLEETLEIMSDQQLMDEIREGRAELAAGRGEVLTHEEVLAQVTPE